jgi:hypothetical protein
MHVTHIPWCGGQCEARELPQCYLGFEQRHEWTYTVEREDIQKSSEHNISAAGGTLPTEPIPLQIQEG